MAALFSINGELFQAFRLMPNIEVLSASFSLDFSRLQKFIKTVLRFLENAFAPCLNFEFFIKLIAGNRGIGKQRRNLRTVQGCSLISEWRKRFDFLIFLLVARFYYQFSCRQPHKKLLGDILQLFITKILQSYFLKVVVQHI
ncbi:MAG TPA: hypothetical protein VNI84_04440 [Pyrinomonadaceae bacterium]|nr:hypothetical protein [Pyrinomonadaceae bacterium]